jgi:hypothetical protein
MNRSAAPLAALALVVSSAAALAQHAPLPSASAVPAAAAPRPDLGSGPALDPALADPGSFVADPPPAEPTPVPKLDEWSAAPAVRLTRDVAACTAYRVREWVKIHCAGSPAAGVSLLAGTRTGVALWVDPPKDASETMKTPRTAEVIFPVRRGDGRLFQVGQFGEGYDGPVAWNLAYTVSEQWIEGARAPTLTVR